MNFILSALAPYAIQIISGLVGLAGIGIALFTASQSGKKTQKLQDENNTLKETINASKVRTQVDATVANTPDAQRDGMLDAWNRDKQP